MVAHRIADPFILRLIGKWLNAGFMVAGVATRTEEGSPQGGPISPILSNMAPRIVVAGKGDHIVLASARLVPDETNVTGILTM
jgi:hypothetical protein